MKPSVRLVFIVVQLLDSFVRVFSDLFLIKTNKINFYFFKILFTNSQQAIMVNNCNLLKANSFLKERKEKKIHLAFEDCILF